MANSKGTIAVSLSLIANRRCPDAVADDTTWLRNDGGAGFWKVTNYEYGRAQKGRKHWKFAPDDDPLAEIDAIAGCFRLNLAVRYAEDEKDRRQKAHLQHLADRRALAKKRREREVEREAFVTEVANAQRKIDEFRSAISTLDSTRDPSPEYARMVSWAKRRMVELERSAQMESLTAKLIEKKLFPEPDDLYDPEGEPPSGSGVWD